MQGTERRIEARGRRASDSVGVKGLAHERAVFLSALLVLSMALFLVARDQSRPEREIETLRHDALQLEAKLHAERIALQSRDLEHMLEVAATRLDVAQNPALNALEQAQSTLSVPTSIALFNPAGAVEARKGEAVIAREGVSLNEGRLNLGRRMANGGVLAASLALPPMQPTISDASLEVRYGTQLPAAVFENPHGVQILDAAGLPRLTVAAPIGDTGLAVVADRPGLSLFQRWQDDARILVLPLLLGVILLGLLTFKTLRHDRAARTWALTERRFRVAVEAARCGVWEWDLERKKVELSDYMAALLELPKGSILNNAEMVERVHPRYRDAFVSALDRARENGQFEAAFPISLQNGQVRWLDVRGRSPIEGNIKGQHSQLLGIALDITEARLAKARAEAAETRLIDGIQSVSDAFVLFDRHGHLLLWNEAFQEAFNVPEHLLRRGTPKNELNRVASLAIKSEHNADKRRAGVREVELKDGRWLQMTERYTGDGGTVVIAADVTVIRQQEGERRRAAEALQSTVEELEASQARLGTLAKEYEAAMTRAEAASQSKSEFLANMSHELRTPLNAINGFSEIMAGEMFGPLGDKRYRGYAQDIHNSGKHLLSLINDILDMAKIEAGKLSLHYENTDLSGLGREVVRLMRGRAEEAGLSLSIDAPEVLNAQIDVRGIKQVLLNLVSNAIKFTPQAGRVMLTLRPLSERPGYVRIAVHDTGIGIAAEDIIRLAQPFVQVENQHAKTTKGTGLGLALTKSLIEMHGSNMTIDSEPGRGTTVWFDLEVSTETMAEPALGTFWHEQAVR